MRFISFILATYIFFLTDVPVARDIYSALTKQTEECYVKNCCKNDQAEPKQKPEKQHSDDCCTNEICNPFEYCTCCFVLSVSSQTLGYAPHIFISKQTIPTSADIMSDYISDCFHPPEIV